jgi:hypothetical protein
MKDMALSENGMDAAWHVLMQHTMAGEWHGNGMCELAFRPSRILFLECYFL